MVSAPYVLAVIGRNVSMLDFSEALQSWLGTYVWNQTGMEGNYNFDFLYAADGAPTEVEVQDLFAAIQEALGLKLEKHTGPMEVLVVDHIEKRPTPN
jgi:uncharacterized protein (TIGR03435 family)